MIACDTGELVASNSHLGQPQVMRDRLRSDGYLYLRGVLDRDLILGLRLDILEIFKRHGWLLPGSSVEAGLTDHVPAVEGEDAFLSVYDDVQKLESFHAFSHCAELSDIVQQAVGPTAFPHPLGVARLGFPNNEECTTPPHQDYPNNQGTRELYATWIPLGDCPRVLGGLSVLENSQSLGLLPLAFSLGAGGRQAQLPDKGDDSRWLSADYDCGDVVIFGSLTVHRSLPNLSGHQFRLSVDYRFQEEGKSLTGRVLEPHFGRMQWSEIYRDWNSTALQYYWRGKDFNQVSWDDSLHQLPEEHLADAVHRNRMYYRRRQNWQRAGSVVETSTKAGNVAASAVKKNGDRE